MCAVGPTSLVSLSYSSPSLARDGHAVGRFYNAFPEFNSLARDGSFTGFPSRARHNVPLDSAFIPSGRWIGARELTADLLRKLPRTLQRVVSTAVTRTPSTQVMIPWNPALNDEFILHHDFELVHKRLVATEQKLVMRLYLLGRLYTELEHALIAHRTIAVPVPYNARGTPLEHYWTEVAEAFATTRVIDEAVSLVVTLIMSAHTEYLAHEEGWVAEGAREVPDFDHVYRALRQYFDLSVPRTIAQRRSLAEKAIKLGKAMLRVRHPDGEEVRFAWADDKYNVVHVPRFLRRAGVPALRLYTELLLKGSPAFSIPEAVQYVLAVDAVQLDQKQAFTRADGLWPEYAGFALHLDGDDAWVTVEPEPSFVHFVQRNLTAQDGSQLDKDTSQLVASYAIVMESLRQQLCLGVGLRCPFWRGQGCCAFAPLLDAAYCRVRLRHPAFATYWEKPPCRP